MIDAHHGFSLNFSFANVLHKSIQFLINYNTGETQEITVNLLFGQLNRKGVIPVHFHFLHKTKTVILKFILSIKLGWKAN